MILKALSKDRDERYADVPAFVAALVERPGRRARRAAARLDPGRPRADPGRPPAPSATGAGRRACRRVRTPRARRTWPWVVAAVARVSVDRRLRRAHERAATPTAPSTTRPGRSRSRCRRRGPRGRPRAVGRRRSRRRPARRSRPAPARAGTTTPTRPGRVPRRPPRREAADARAAAPRLRAPRGPIFDERDGDRYMTVFFTGCPGADLTVERVVQVDRQPAVVGAGPRRRPRHRQRRARLGGRRLWAAPRVGLSPSCIPRRPGHQVGHARRRRPCGR